MKLERQGAPENQGSGNLKNSGVNVAFWSFDEGFLCDLELLIRKTFYLFSDSAIPFVKL